MERTAHTERIIMTTRKLTPRLLKKIVLQEKARIKRRKMREVLETGKNKPEDVKADEVEPDEYASTLEKDVNHLKAIGVKESRLKRQYKKLQEQKRIVKRRLKKNINK